MDHDTYSAGSLIGTCVIDLNTMLMRPDYDNTQDSCFSGWIPIYDTLEGIRGELYVDVSFQSIGDKNVGIHSYLSYSLAIGGRISRYLCLCWKSS